MSQLIKILWRLEAGEGGTHLREVGQPGEREA